MSFLVPPMGKKKSQEVIYKHTQWYGDCGESGEGACGNMRTCSPSMREMEMMRLIICSVNILRA